MCRFPKGHLHRHLPEILETWQIQCCEMQETFTKDLEELKNKQTEMNNTLEGINSRIKWGRGMDKSWIFFYVMWIWDQIYLYLYIYSHTCTYSMCVFSFSCPSILLLQHKYFCHEFNKCNSSENKIRVLGILGTEVHERLLTEG